MSVFDVRQNKKRRRTIIGERGQKAAGSKNILRVKKESSKRNVFLLNELRKEGRTSKFQDNRLLERHAGVSHAQKYSKRLQLLRSKSERSPKDIVPVTSRDGSEGPQITHGGVPISEASLLHETNSSSDSDEDVPVSGEAHFGGGGEIARKSRQEVYAEIIAKSKKAKSEKARESVAQSDRLQSLDEALGELQSSLKFRPPKWQGDEGDEGGEYESLVRSLAFDKRAVPTDRVRTADDFKRERAAEMHALEAARQAAELGPMKGLGSEDGKDSSAEDNSGLESSDNDSDDESDEESEIVENPVEVEIGTPERHEEIVPQESAKSDKSKTNDEGSDEDAELLTEEFKLNDEQVEQPESDAEGGRRPEWSKNKVQDKGLPFQMAMPSDFAGFKTLMESWNSRQQWKLIWRLRVAYDASLNISNAKLIRQLVEFVLEHLINFEDSKEFFSFIKMIQDHLSDFVAEFPDAVNAFLANTLIAAINVLIEGTEPVWTQRTLRLIELCVLFYGSLEDSKHQIFTPTLGLLDLWSSAICNFQNATFLPEEKAALPTIKEKELEIAMELAFIQSSLQRFYYLPSRFPLYAALLQATQQTESLQVEVCQMIQKSLTSFQERNLSTDVITRNILIPCINSLSNKSLQVISLESAIEKLMARSLPPINLASSKPLGIRMLTPKYADPRRSSQWLRLKGASGEQLAAKKLKREHKDARRGAFRQLKKDAEFLAAVQTRDKRKRNAEREEQYKSVVSALNKEQEDIHKMRTSVTAGSRKKIKNISAA